MKISTEQEHFWDYEIKQILYTREGTGLEQTIEEGSGKSEKNRLEERKN